MQEDLCRPSTRPRQVGIVREVHPDVRLSLRDPTDEIVFCKLVSCPHDSIRCGTQVRHPQFADVELYIVCGSEQQTLSSDEKRE